MSRQIASQTHQQKSTAIHAASGLLQRTCACGNHTLAGGECEECGKMKRIGLQTKLKVNEPGDVFEQEADRIADQMVAAPVHSCVSITPPSIQRFSGQATGQMEAAPASVDQALASPCRPLEPALRQDMEQRFGHDFSRVRVHTGTAAEQSARDVNAHAYTVGNNIVFDDGEFSPASAEGRKLLAHELTHVAQNVSGGDLSVIRRAPAPDPYEIISPVWNVGGRDVVIVRMRADGRAFFFYRRSGLGSKGKFEPSAPQEGKWVPFEGFEEVEALKFKGLKEIGKLGELERLAKLQNLPGEYVTTYRFHKEPYYYAPAVEAGQVAPGYGTQTHKGIAEWLDKELPPGKIKGEVANWGDVQKVLEKHAPRNLPFPGEETPQPAISKSGEIGGPGRPRSGPSGGGTVEAMVEETTERIVKRVPTVPKPQSPIESPFPGSGMPEPVLEPKPGFRSAAAAGARAGLKEAFSAGNIAAIAIPEVILRVSDIAAARDAIRRIETKFAKEGFAKGVAAGVTEWSEEQVASNLKNRVTPFRVRGLEDPGGLLGYNRILQLAVAYENYAVILGYQFSSSKTSKWKGEVRAKGLAVLAKRGYHFGEEQSSAPAVKRVYLGNVIVEEELDPAESGPEPKPRYLFEYGFIDKLAWVLRPFTNPIIEKAIEKGDEKRRVQQEAELKKMKRESGAVGMKY